MRDAIRLRSYAKINLYLDVLPQRPDGFHNIETVFQTVGLFDELAIEARDNDINLRCSNPELDCGPTNLVYRAATLLQERAGCTLGAEMYLDKRIPVAAGLAGGSGNAAAALVGLNAVWNLGFTDAELERFGLELGSDVPYCIRGGTVAATGRGEIMEQLAPMPKTWCVLAHPALHVSTRAVYTSPLLVKNPDTPVDGRTTSFCLALANLAAGDVAGMLFNRMEIPVFTMHPELATIRQNLVDAGCFAARMSGSGPTVFGLCASETQALAVVTALKPLRCSAVPFVNAGVEVVA